LRPTNMQRACSGDGMRMPIKEINVNDALYR
jgi:hypothetical protein